MKQTEIDQLVSRYPLVKQMIGLQEVCWFNPKVTDLVTALPYVGLNRSDVQDASDRLTRFAPYIKQVFPETQQSNGIIELSSASAIYGPLMVGSDTEYLKQVGITPETMANSSHVI